MPMNVQSANSLSLLASSDDVFLVVQQIPGVVFDLFRFVGAAFWLLRFDVDRIEVGRTNWLGGGARSGFLAFGQWWRCGFGVRFEATPVVGRGALTGGEERRIIVLNNFIGIEKLIRIYTFYR